MNAKRRALLLIAAALGLAAAACGGGGNADDAGGADEATPEEGGTVDAEDAAAPDASADGDACAPVDGPGADDAGAETPGDAAGEEDAAASCRVEPVPGHQEIDCPDGVHYDVEVPASCPLDGCGLIVDIHGLTMTGDQEDAHTRLRALAPSRGYAVIQPTSPGSLHEWSSGIYDAGVWEFVVAARDGLAVDPDRVHVMGFSQGSMMTLRLLCAHSGEIASVAPTAGGGCFASGGGPETARPILYTHGTSDALVSFPDVGVPLREGVLARYGLGSGDVFASGAAYTATGYEDGSGDVVFEFWQHDFSAPPFMGVLTIGGHCLPGPVSEEAFRCRDDGQYDHTEQVLRFFGEHPRP